MRYSSFKIVSICEAGASLKGSFLIMLHRQGVMSLLIGPHTTFMSMGSVFAFRVGNYI